VSKLSAKGWKSLVARDKDKIKSHRHDIHALASETGLEIGEFRASAPSRASLAARPAVKRRQGRAQASH
jgi:hypothetical protein